MLRYFILSYLFFFAPFLRADDVTFDDLTIIISSCDKYQECWTPCCTLLHRYWPGLKTTHKNVPVVLITNELDFTFPGIQTFKTGSDKSWTDNLMAVLAQVKTPYVLYLQEDYFLSRAVDEAGVRLYLDALKHPDIGYVQISQGDFFKDCPRHPVYKDAVIKKRFMDFRTSLQAALWNKELLMHLLKPGESAWTFEIDGTIRSDGSEALFLSVQDHVPLAFANGCAAGFWTSSTLPFLAAEGLPVITTVLPVDTEFPLSYWMRQKRPKWFPFWKRWMGLFYPQFRGA